MVLLDRRPDVDSSAGLPDKGLEETFDDHLCSRPPAVHLLDVRWRFQLINSCLFFYLNSPWARTLKSAVWYQNEGQILTLIFNNIDSCRLFWRMITMPNE